MAYANDERVRAKAMRAELGESSNGNVQVGIEFAILDTGGRMTWYGSFSEKAKPFTLKGLRAAGWTGLDVSDLGSLDASMTETPEVELVIGDHEYEGKTSRRIKFINRGGGLNMKAPLQGDALKAFAAKMRLRRMERRLAERPTLAAEIAIKRERGRVDWYEALAREGTMRPSDEAT